MKKEAIAAIPIHKITDNDCILFMWMIWNRLPDALYVMDKWGFKYIGSAFTWVKRSKGGEKWHFGMGNYTRQNSETCIFGIKGKPRRISASVRSVMDCPVMEHSKKPNEVRARIVQLMGDLPRIELFARQKTEGWDVWGNEVESDINLSC
jgi:N6-adenosine-specific RNA methylase IME4